LPGETVALLEGPAFGIDNELRFFLDYQARFLAVMKIACTFGSDVTVISWV